MAAKTDTRQRTTLGNRFRFLVRVFGLTGALALPVGWVLAGDALPPWPPGPIQDAVPAYGDSLLALAQKSPDLQVRVGVICLLAGGAAVALMLLDELFNGLFLVAGRKTVVGTNSAVQVALAAALLVVVNAISFGTYWRWDLTRDRQFTLAPELVGELKKLRPDSPTTVIVLQLHKTAGTLSDKPDAFDSAAERKVVEKVKDLVDQLREFGPRFNVAVLDVQEEGFERQLRDLTRDRPGLAEAVAAAPENSIFFYPDGKVQSRPRAEADKLAAGKPVLADPADPSRGLVYTGPIGRMSFTDFYQLDKTASKEATPAEREDLAALAGGTAFGPGVRGKGNLVLLPRGQAAFVRKVLALEERKPRVGLAVIHPLLTSREGYDEYTAAGLRKALEANGFDVTEVILKQWSRSGPPTPAAEGYEEYELGRIESRYNLFTGLVAYRESQVKQLAQVRDRVNTAPLAELDRLFGRQLGRRIADDADRAFLRKVIDDSIQINREELAELTKLLAELTPRYKEAFANDRAVENRRLTDLKAKLGQAVADCDLLIVPRLTVVDLARGDVIPPNLFNLAKEQAEMVKEFVKAGKPVLFALGPTNVDRRGEFAGPEADDVEEAAPAARHRTATNARHPAEAEAMAERQGKAASARRWRCRPWYSTGPHRKPSGQPGRQRTGSPPRAVDRRPGSEEGRVPADVREQGDGRPVAVRRRDRVPARRTRGTRRSHAGRRRAEFDPAKPNDPKKGTRDEERAARSPWKRCGRNPDPRGLAGQGQGRRVRPGGRRGGGGVLVRQGTDRGGGVDGGGHGEAADGAGGRPRSRRAVRGKRLDPARGTALARGQLATAPRRPAAGRGRRRGQVAVPARVDLSSRQFRVWHLATFLGLPARRNPDISG
ncbi:MAG: hypothetical protein U0871_22625 [Gemmataceae bacterium]